jgi:hypothetical protein
MDNQDKDIKEELLDKINKNISNATELVDDTEIKINYLFYFIGIILIIITYLGPYFYYKIIKKKSFNPQRNIGVKHVI